MQRRWSCRLQSCEMAEPKSAAEWDRNYSMVRHLYTEICCHWQRSHQYLQGNSRQFASLLRRLLRAQSWQAQTLLLNSGKNTHYRIPAIWLQIDSSSPSRPSPWYERVSFRSSLSSLPDVVYSGPALFPRSRHDRHFTPYVSSSAIACLCRSHLQCYSLFCYKRLCW